MQRATKLALVLFCGALCGCRAMLAEAVVSAPNRFQPWVGSVEDLEWPRALLGIRDRFDVPLPGENNAHIAVSVVDPPRQLTDPAGTILILHGIRAQGLWMLPIAYDFADQGYRAVVVDLPGHGSSPGETLSFGFHESRHLARVIDELESRGLIAGKVGVFGHSYGATTAIHLAASDPRVAAVVAAAPFADVRDEVPQYIRTIAPGLGHLIPDPLFADVVAIAGERADFDPASANALDAIARVRVPVLLLHGLSDRIIPCDHSLRLHFASCGTTRLKLLPRTNHFSIWFDPRGEVARESQAWFAEHLRTDASEISPR